MNPTISSPGQGEGHGQGQGGEDGQNGSSSANPSGNYAGNGQDEDSDDDDGDEDDNDEETSEDVAHEQPQLPELTWEWNQERENWGVVMTYSNGTYLGLLLRPSLTPSGYQTTIHWLQVRQLARPPNLQWEWVGVYQRYGVLVEREADGEFTGNIPIRVRLMFERGRPIVKYL